MHFKRFLVITVTVFVFAATIALKFLPIPFFWISILGVGGAILTITRMASHQRARQVVLLLGTLCFMFGMLELLVAVLPLEFLANQRGRHITGKTSPSYDWDRPHLLGYAPSPEQTVRATRSWKDSVIYDVTYTINKDGLRDTGQPETEVQGAILFFGGSFTFGEGVNDNETLPAQVVAACNERIAAYNFGFHGYGPHQMLAAMRSGYVDQRIQQVPRFIVYQAIPAHAHRAAGWATWSRKDPRFVISEDGTVVQRGTLKIEDSRLFSNRIARQFLKSQAVAGMYSLIRNCKYGKWFTNNEIRMFREIVRAAVHEAARRYPGCEFHAIFWDTENPTDRAAEFSRALQDAGCRVHLISDIIPDIETAMAGTYQIPHDNHPNPAAYRIMADYVARTIAKCDAEPR